MGIRLDLWSPSFSPLIASGTIVVEAQKRKEKKKFIFVFYHFVVVEYFLDRVVQFVVYIFVE